MTDNKYYSRGFEGGHMPKTWDAKAAYGGDDEDGYFYVGNYTTIVESFGAIQAEWTEDDYQGSSMMIVKSEDGFYGLVEFGWGSCSGCDSLQACSNWQDVEALRESMGNGVEWFKTKAALRLHVNSADLEGRFWGDEKARAIRDMIAAWHPGTIAEMEESLEQ